MTVDVEKVQFLLYYSHLPWSAPLQIALALYFLFAQLGPAVFVGLGIMILLIPINWIIQHHLFKFQAIQMKTKDERVKLMNEILSGMKILKLYAWERLFESRVQEVREREIHNLRLQSYLNSGMELAFQSSPFLVSLATFGAYTLLEPNETLDAQKVFVSMALFNILKVPVIDLPRFISQIATSRISLKRINKFLNAEEKDPHAVNWIQSTVPSEISKYPAAAVTITNGKFTWAEDDCSTLENINVSILKGQLVAVVGTVGSGKSSLLSAILGEIKRVEGKLEVIESLAYVAQVAWIQNATVKENILFGNVYEESKYNQVLESCALRPDLAVLPGGDETEIGEKGINLSGGQKQRVALARAAYHAAELFLFDDPLSAVDAHVATHLFEKLIGPGGILRNKTRIMVTHSVTFLSQVDHIIVMKDGTLSERGTYKELQASRGAFSDFLAQHAEEEKPNSEIPKVKKNETREVDLKSGLGTKLIQTETVKEGSVKFKVFLKYFKSMGWHTVCFVVIFYALAQGKPCMNTIF